MKKFYLIFSKELLDVSVCKYSEYQARVCTDRNCNLCGTKHIKEYIIPLITDSYNNVFKFP